jgi:hypothetical protein
MSPEEARELVASNHRAVLITRRSGGGLQTSPVLVGVDDEPTIVKLANGWVISNVGGGPTDDNPRSCWYHRPIPLAPAPSATSGWPTSTASIRSGARAGPRFLTPPKVHSQEIRCYMHDPTGQTTGVPT